MMVEAVWLAVGIGTGLGICSRIKKINHQVLTPWDRVIRAKGGNLEELGEALRAFYCVGKGFQPMGDPRGEKHFLDWDTLAFGIPEQAVSDAFYEFDTASAVSGAHPVLNSFESLCE